MRPGPAEHRKSRFVALSDTISRASPWIARVGGLGHNGLVKFASTAAASTEPIPATRDRLVGLLLERGPATVHILAERLGLTSAAVRRHLDALVVSGMVAASDRPPYGPVGRRRRGRPAKVFSLTEAGRAQFRQSYDTLATAALRHLEAELGPEAVAEFARMRVEALVGPHRQAVLSTAPEQRAEVLARVLSEDGFAASVEPAPHGSGDQLCQHHCPVAHVAAEFPQLCEAETMVFAELLGTHVQRLATIGHGDHVCTTYVPHPDEGTRR